MADRPVLLLIDAPALVHRAFHAMRGQGKPLTTKAGEPVEAVLVFARMLLVALRQFQPRFYAAAFDLPAPTFRHLEFKEYKATRPPLPDDLRRQFLRVRQLLQAFGMPSYELDRYEADDILGTLARQAEERGLETVVLTGDTDMLQLVTPHVTVMLPGRSLATDTVAYTPDKVRERYGLAPAQIVDFKGLKGDTSDNIPGIPGVGEKTATELLQQFGSVEDIYQRIDEVQPAKRQALLRQHEAQARQSVHLARIVVTVPMELDLQACDARGYDRARVVELLRELEFNSIVKDLPLTATAERPALAAETDALVPGHAVPEQVRYITAPTVQEVTLAASQAGDLYALALDAVGENPMYAQVLGLAVCHQPGQATYVPLAGSAGSVAPAEARALLKPMLEDSAVPKWGHDIKRAVVALSQQDIELQGVGFDTMLAAHLLGEKALSLKALALGRLKVELLEPPKPASRRGAQKKAAEEEGAERGAALFPTAGIALTRPLWPEGPCAEADMVARLVPGMEQALKEQGLWGLYSQVEMPLIPVLATMERNGIAVDTQVLVQMSQVLARRLQELEVRVYNDVGHQFNINSPQQLGQVLFEERNIDRRQSKKTKTGWSTDAQVLEKLRGADPVVAHVLEYRELSKLKSTYLDALPALVHPRTGRLHTTFNQAGAATGRISSNEPNLQNIPVRTELGREIRKAFRAEREGWTLLGADYSQIDLRVLAHLSGDQELIAAFRQGQDIHRATASQIFGLPPDQVDADHRRMAKTINFGIVYGISPFGLSERIEGLSREDAGKFIDAYFQRYPQVREYMDRTVEQARKEGYVQTLLGRRRYIPEVHASNYAQRQGAERIAINMPVQGTSADIIKVAMVRLDQRMRREGLRSLLLLQIHDELLFEAPEEELEHLKALCLEIMPSAVELVVPIKVDLKVGRTWGDME